VLAPETTRTIAYYRRLTVLYETPAGHLRNLTLRGDEACVMTALL